MALFPNPFRKRETPEKAERERLRALATTLLPDATFTISEIDCGDPACPGLETFILVMREGEATQAVKVKKPMPEVGDADLREAMRYL